MNRQEIFAHYELDNSRWTAVIFKLLAASLVLHGVFLLSAIYIPAVRDALYVALLFSDAPSGWDKSKNYKKTTAEEVTVINTPRDDKFQYPAGYFSEVGAAATLPDVNDLTAMSGDNGFGQPMTTPFEMTTPTATPYVPPTYTPPAVNLPARRSSTTSGLPKLPKTKKDAKVPPLGEVNGANATAKTDASPTPKKDAAATTILPQNPIGNLPDGSKLLQQPLIDVANEAIGKLNDKTKPLDLNKPINVTVKGVLGDNGKFVNAPQFTNNGGDAELAQMATKLVLAMNDSGLLSYVKAICGGSKKCDVVFNVSKDEKDVKFQLISTAANEAEANKTQSGLNIFILGAAIAKNGTEEGELLKAIKVVTDKNRVVINWQMDTPTAMKKIQDKLAEVQRKPQSSSQTTTPDAQANTK